MKILDLIVQPEGRRLEFKEALPTVAELVKTVIAFANDAGGELFVGIQDVPRLVIGVQEDALISLEEKISNIIFDQCAPIIIPEISFVNVDGKYIIRVQIYKGGNPPYYQKNKSIEHGTFIRVGSSNRLASPEIIAELLRQRQNTSFDSEVSHLKTVDALNITAFGNQFFEVTGEKLNKRVLGSLDLIRNEQGQQLATNALILLSDDELRQRLFPYAIVECARFKGTTPGIFIDQKTIDVNIALQAEQAYQFVLRHISKSSVRYTGVYRNDRWEYPVTAIREAIRNAIIHRDYSLTGKDIKIAIFDDKIEITSPGKLLPSVDFDDMESGQSDIRNKLLAPVFKKLGIIEKWGNGLQLIANELKSYPQIGFEWKEPGLAFRLVFFKKDFEPDTADEYPVVANFVRDDGGGSGINGVYTTIKPLDTTIENSETTIKTLDTTIENDETTIKTSNTTIGNCETTIKTSDTILKPAEDSSEFPVTVIKSEVGGILKLVVSDGDKAAWARMATVDKVVFLLAINPHLSSTDLAALIGDITFHGINYHLKHLVAKGSIKHFGPKKGGHWMVITKDLK
jgi:ATP-dependent DNA helicase RecG